MKKNKIFKRVISIILAFVLVMGIAPSQKAREVEASESPEFTLSLESVNGKSWTFGHSELDAAYEGVEATWQPMRYQFDAYRDGSETPVKVWIEFVGSKAYFWNGNHFADKAAPESSLVIKKDTVFTEFNVTNGDAGDGEVVATGKTMVLKETFNAVAENGAWVEKTESSQPEVTGPEFTLSLESVNGKSWTFGHSELDAAYEGDEATWRPMRYQFDAYRDGSETPVKVWIEFVGSKAYFWNGNHFADKAAPESSLVIKKDTVFTEFNVTNGDTGDGEVVATGKTMVLKETFNAVAENGAWVEKTEPSQPGVTGPEFTLSLESVNGKSWTFGHSELDAAYEGVEATWQPMRYQFDAYRDGSETPVKVWIEFVGSKAYFWNGNHFADKAAPESSLVIKKDTVFTEFNVKNGDTGDGEVVATGKTMVLKETFNAVAENGAWVQKTEPTEPDEPDTPEEPDEPNIPSIDPPAVDGPKVALGLISTDGTSWTFEHSKLDAAYEGIEAGWKPIRYQLEVYRDNSKTPVKVWIEFVGSKAYFWGADNFEDSTSPKSSLVIPKGTAFYEYNVDTGAVVTNGKAMALSEDFIAVLKNGEWSGTQIPEEPDEPDVPDIPNEPDIPSITPPTVDGPKVALGFISSDGRTWTLEHSELDDAYQGEEAGWKAVRYQLEVYRDGESTPVKVWMEFVGSKAYFWNSNNFADNVSPTSSLVIPKGTVFYEFELTNADAGIGEVVKNGKTMALSEDFVAVTKNGAWTGTKLPDEPVSDVCNDIRIKYDRFEGVGFYIDVEIVAGPDKGKNVSDVYGEWPASVPTGNLTYKRSGVDETMKVLYSPCFGNEIYISGDYQVFMEELTHFTISKGTIITPKLRSKSLTPMRVMNTVKLQKYDEYGIWAEAGTFTEKTKFNDVKLTFSHFDGRGFYVSAKIVAGPNKGKNVAEVYGDWAEPVPTGNIAFTLGDTEQIMNVLWSPCNSNMFYVSGNFSAYADQLTSVTISKNTVIIPTMANKSKTPIRITNNLELEKESVYGVWGLKGKVKTPTEFTDVILEVKWVRGHALLLNVKLANGQNTSIAELYGYGASVYGDITLVEPGMGKYVDNKAVYTIEDNCFKLYGILPALKDSIEIKAGTVLLQHNACKTAKPIRIMNTVKLTRDAEDEWVYKASKKISSAEIGSPQTGDTISTDIYVVGLMVSAAIVAIFWFEKRRRLYVKKK